MPFTHHRVRDVALVEAAIGEGARDPGCRDGGAVFWRDSQSALAAEPGLTVRWHAMARERGIAAPLAKIARANAQLAATVEGLSAAGTRFITLGGDHSCAVGTWSGAARALRPLGSIGLVWIDAHMDMHVPETTWSGYVNGMPVAALLGHGAPLLTGLAEGPALDPRHVCLVGVRSFEPEEMALARRLGVRVIEMDEVRARGLDAALAEAQAIATAGTVGYGVSLDLDGLDPADVPAVATPEPGGIPAADLAARWGALTGGDTCIGAEIVEYNPYAAGAAETARWMQRLVGRSFAA